MMRHPAIFKQSRARRGSILILVVAILAVLALLVSALSYSTRMELYASRNFVDEIQARLSAITGIPSFESANFSQINFGLTNDLRPTSTSDEPVVLDLIFDEQDKATAPSVKEAGVKVTPAANFAPSITGLGGAQSAANQAVSPPSSDVVKQKKDILELASFSMSFMNSLAAGEIQDEASKININTILPRPEKEARTPKDGTLGNSPITDPQTQLDANDLARLIDAIFLSRNKKFPVSPQQIADAIVLHRYGADGKPGVATVDDNGNSGINNPNSDSLDNDGDLIVDNPEEEASSFDADGLDNNRDGIVDEPGESITQDGLDNDHNGEVDNNEEGVDEPAEFVTDPRLPPHGDDRPYESLDDLLSVPGVTPEIFYMLRPFLTTFSVGHPAYLTGTGKEVRTGLRQLDPNSASADQIYKAIEQKFRTMAPDAIGQFVVNLVDRRDLDDVPSSLQLGTKRKTYTGVEITPRINEVYPFTGDLESDDDGQFVELINPHGSDISLAGWRIEAGGKSIFLHGSLTSQGLLVITDDYNESTDTDPVDIPGRGSLYDIFGVVPIGNDGRIQVEPLLDLSDDTGEVVLLDPHGVRIDSFAYSNGRVLGINRISMQRTDPLSSKERYTRDDGQTATPLKPSRNAVKRSREELENLKYTESFQNQPIRSPLEILMVEQTYSGSGSDEETAAANPTENPNNQTEATTERTRLEEQELLMATLLPALRTTRGGTFDLTLVDMFLPGVSQKRHTRIFGTPVSQQTSSEGETIEKLYLKVRQWRDSPRPMFGRINLNTAPPAVIASLPGMSPELAYRIAYVRQPWVPTETSPTRKIPDGLPKDYLRSAKWFEALPPMATPRWRSLSDFIQDLEVWGTMALPDRLNTTEPFSMMVDFHSLAYTITTENIPPANQKIAGRKPTYSRTARIITGDRGEPEMLSFKLFGDHLNGIDSGIQYAAQAKEPLPPEFDPKTPKKLLHAAKVESLSAQERQRVEPIDRRNGSTNPNRDLRTSRPRPAAR